MDEDIKRDEVNETDSSDLSDNSNNEINEAENVEPVRSENDDTVEQSSIDSSESISVQSTPSEENIKYSGGSSGDNITVSKEKLWKYSTFILIAVVLVGAFFNFDGSGTGAVVDNGDVPTPTPTPSKVEVSIDDDAVKGDKDAPVTIVEFSDYECPFCARFYSQAYQDIIKNYIDAGKVKLVFRDFPLGFHQNAQKAAEAAECAGEQDKYYDMHDKLFENGVTGGIASFKQYASQIGLNQGDFDNCLDSGEMANEVKKDMAQGQSYGVQGTPAFFVNGKLISGAQPFSVFQQAIEAEL
jgi:protein-disulfide isomerase